MEADPTDGEFKLSRRVIAIAENKRREQEDKETDRKFKLWQYEQLDARRLMESQAVNLFVGCKIRLSTNGSVIEGKVSAIEFLEHESDRKVAVIERDGLENVLMPFVVWGNLELLDG